MTDPRPFRSVAAAAAAAAVAIVVVVRTVAVTFFCCWLWDALFVQRVRVLDRLAMGGFVTFVFAY